MKKLFLVLLAVLFFASFAWGADTKISDMTADATPTSDDLTVTVNDPAGTPANRKVTLGNLSIGMNVVKDDADDTMAGDLTLDDDDAGTALTVRVDAPGAAAGTPNRGILITSDDDDDADYDPFQIRDDSGGNDDLLFNIDHTGAITNGSINGATISGYSASMGVVSNALGELISSATVSVAELEYIANATGTTGTNTTNIVFSASPTLTGTATTDTTLVNLLDASGAVDMDYGSADVTDHTFISDGGTVVIDGTITTQADNPYVVLADDDDADVYIQNDDVGEELEFSTDSTPGSNVVFKINHTNGNAEVVGDLTITGGNITTATTFDDEVIIADGKGITFDESAADPNDADVKFSATDGVLTIAAVNGANNEDLTLNLDATADTATITSSTSVASLDFSAINLITTGTITGAINIVTTTDGSESPTAAQMYGSFFIADHATAANDTDYTLPTAVAGMCGCFYDNGAGTGGIIIDASAGDEILLEGTGVGVADAIDSPGVAGDGANGDFICLLAIDATYWVTLGSSGTWVDGGAD